MIVVPPEVRESKSEHEIQVELLCQVVDEFCPPSEPSANRKRGGQQRFDDNTIVKMELLGRLCGKKGETELLRHLSSYYTHLFPTLPCQSWLWRRLKGLMPVFERFRAYLKMKLGVNDHDIRIIDTAPIPVFKTVRLGRGNGFDRASWGYCASKKLHYYGFKLMLSITPSGIPDVYDICSARHHDSNALEELVENLQDVLVLGDKAFIDDQRQLQLYDTQGIHLITFRRTNQHRQNAPLEQWILKKRRSRIETTISQLDDLMHIQRLGAKTDTGLAKRLIAAMTAFSLGIYLNRLLGKPLMSVKKLFA